jgi:hypothetical protein
VTYFNGVADEVQRHLGQNGLIGVHDLKVDMPHGALHRVALDLTRHDGVLLAVGVERDQRVQTLVTHDAQVAAAAQRVVRMLDGRIVTPPAAAPPERGASVTMEAR